MSTSTCKCEHEPSQYKNNFNIPSYFNQLFLMLTLHIRKGKIPNKIKKKKNYCQHDYLKGGGKNWGPGEEIAD